VMTLLTLTRASNSDFVDREVTSIGNGVPRLHLVENFASDAEMDLIMKKAFADMRPQNQQAETGMVTELPIGSSPVFTDVYDRMGSIFPGLGHARRDSDTLRVRRYLEAGKAYEGGDYHPPHTDWFETQTGDTSDVLIVTMILYLTSPEKGGTTLFANARVNGTQGYHFQPKRGNLAVWWSCYSNGTQDFHSEHSSEPLLKGIKWNAARFFYDNTKKCNMPALKTVKVPRAADNNVPQTDSSLSMFGTTFPEGVWAVPGEGTSTKDKVHYSGYGYTGDDDKTDDADVPKYQGKKKRAKKSGWLKAKILALQKLIELEDANRITGDEL